MGSNNQHIVWYEPLVYQRLDGDIQTYHEFCVAFDNLAATCRARGQAFEKATVDPAVMLQWLRNNGHANNNAGRSAYSATLNALHVDIDHVPPKQTYAAANFGNILGPVNPWGSRMNYAALPHMDPFRK